MSSCDAFSYCCLFLSSIFSAVAFMHVCFTVGPEAAGTREWGWGSARGSTDTQSSCCCCCFAYLKAFIIEKVLRLCVAIAGSFHLTCRSHLIFHLEWPLASRHCPSVPCTILIPLSFYLVLSLPASSGQPQKCVKSTVSVDSSWLRLCL